MAFELIFKVLEFVSAKKQKIELKKHGFIN